MNNVDKAIVRACLVQIELGMSEAREVRDWWETLSEERRTEWKDFGASVSLYLKALTE